MVLSLLPVVLLLLHAPGSLGDTIAERSWEHFGLVNELRAAGFTCPEGQSYAPNDVPLKFDCRLWKASQLHSQDMADNGYFSHTSQDGRSPWDRAEEQGIRANGENIAAGRSGASSVLEQWKNSDGHCKNMMNPGFRVFAVGYAYNPSARYRHYWTQMFKSSDVSDLDTSCYIQAATTSTTATTTTTTTSSSSISSSSTTTTPSTSGQSEGSGSGTEGATTLPDTDTTTSAAPGGSANSTNSTHSMSSTSASATAAPENQTDAGEDGQVSSSTASSTSADPSPATSTSTRSTRSEVVTTTPAETSAATSTAAVVASRERSVLRGQMVLRVSRPSDFLASPELPVLVAALLTHLLGEVPLESVSYTLSAPSDSPRLRPQPQPRRLAADVAISFTVEVPAGKAQEASELLAAPGEALEAVAQAHMQDFTVEVRGVEVTSVEELAEPLGESSPVGPILAGTSLFLCGAAGFLACWCRRKREHQKQAPPEGGGTDSAQVPPMNLPGFEGDKDLRQSRSSIVISHL